MVCTISSLPIIHRWGACSVPEARISGGPYETCVISERESYGYAAGWSVGKMGIGRPLPEDGYQFNNNRPNRVNLGCATVTRGASYRLLMANRGAYRCWISMPWVERYAFGLSHGWMAGLTSDWRRSLVARLEPGSNQMMR